MTGTNLTAPLFLEGSAVFAAPCSSRYDDRSALIWALEAATGSNEESCCESSAVYFVFYIPIAQLILRRHLEVLIDRADAMSIS